MTEERDRQRVVSVGLTGGIGAGKSTALAMFAEEGALTLSADGIVHDLYQQRQVTDRLLDRFGAEILRADGSVDRRRLGAAVQGKRAELHWLEELTHPLVAAEIARFAARAPEGSVVVCEVPLLFEAGLAEDFDLIVTVEAAQEQRLRRSAHRTRREAFLEFEDLQASTEERVRRSDLVFRNDGDLEALRTFVRSAYARALSLLDVSPEESGASGRPVG
jgi:dephospho-CoA kinase